MDRALDAVFAGPPDHLACGRPVLDAAKSDFAEQLDAGRCQFLEVVFDHLAFDHRRTGMNLHATGTQRPECALREDRHRLQPDDVTRPAGHVHFAGGDHRRDSAMQIAIDPVDLVLPGCPVAGDGMNVAVDQAGSKRGAIGIDDRRGAVGVEVLEAADGGDLAVLGDDCIGIEDRLFQCAGKYQPDIADHKLAWAGWLRCIMGHCFILDSLSRLASNTANRSLLKK
jgi:hypothetical protein